MLCPKRPLQELGKKVRALINFLPHFSPFCSPLFWPFFFFLTLLDCKEFSFQSLAIRKSHCSLDEGVEAQNEEVSLLLVQGQSWDLYSVLTEPPISYNDLRSLNHYTPSLQAPIEASSVGEKPCFCFVCLSLRISIPLPLSVVSHLRPLV